MLKVSGHLLRVARESMIEWINEASMEEIFLLSTAVALVKISDEAKAKRKVKILKSKKRKITPEESTRIRTVMSCLTKGSKEYFSKRDQLSKEMGITIRQVSSCLWPRKKSHVVPFVSQA